MRSVQWIVAVAAIVAIITHRQKVGRGFDQLPWWLASTPWLQRQLE